MSEILKVFRHLAREIFIYIIPGFFIFWDLLYVFQLNKYDIVNSNFLIDSKIIISIVFSYMFGHFSISFRELIRTFFRLNKDEKNTEQLEKELKVFAVDKVMYEGFIERYNLLHAFRKNMTWISVILCFINLIYVLIDNAHVPFYLVSVIICLILILVFGFNTDNTKHELLRRIDSTHKLVKGKVEPDNKKKETDK